MFEKVSRFREPNRQGADKNKNKNEGKTAPTQEGKRCTPKRLGTIWQEIHSGTGLNTQRDKTKVKHKRHQPRRATKRGRKS